jgi:hypothetical protein
VQRALADVFQIADGRGDNEERAGHAARHCGIAGKTNESPACFGKRGGANCSIDQR